MDSILYDDKPSLGRFIGQQADPHKRYVEHYRNWKVLEFIANDTGASFSMRARARHELEMCERKLEYWKRHPLFQTGRVAQQCAVILRECREYKSAQVG